MGERAESWYLRAVRPCNLIHGEAVVLELVGHPFAGGGVGSLLVLQRVWDAQFVPLRAAKLVESQHVDVFDIKSFFILLRVRE